MLCQSEQRFIRPLSDWSKVSLIDISHRVISGIEVIERQAIAYLAKLIFAVQDERFV